MSDSSFLEVDLIASTFDSNFQVSVRSCFKSVGEVVCVPKLQKVWVLSHIRLELGGGRRPFAFVAPVVLGCTLEHEVDGDDLVARGPVEEHGQCHQADGPYQG